MRFALRLLHVRGHDFPAQAGPASLEELDRLCSAFVRLGTRKLRITGGEPLVRRDDHDAVPRLSRHLATARSTS